MRRALLALVLIGCSSTPAALVREKKLSSVRALQADLEASVEAEKSAVLATSDEEATGFAGESKAASAQFDAKRAELRQLVEADAVPAQLDGLREVDDAWAELKGVDEKLLPLVAASTNRRAAKLSAGSAAEDLSHFVEALTAIEAASDKPAPLRELSKAKADALWVQTLHAPHIASAVDAEMTQMESRIRAWTTEVDGTLAALDKDAPAKAKDALATAHQAWTAYQADTAKVLELSRANSNVIAFDLSVHAKRKAAKRVEAALAAMSSALAQDASKASR